MLSASEWAAQQWAQVDLGDARLTRRAVEIGSRMAAHPESSLPEQMGDPNVLKAAYGLLNHPGISLEALTAEHRRQTLQAAGLTPLVLWVEDTTELDYTAHPSTTGLGPIGNGNGRGLLLHSTLAVEPATRTLLGLAHAQIILREPKETPRPKWARSPEGRVWEVSAAAVGNPPADRTWVHVSDRGSDIFAYMAACVDRDKHFLVRVRYNRSLLWDDPAVSLEHPELAKLLDCARSFTPYPDSTYTVTIPAHDQQPERQATLVLQWQQVVIPAPQSAAPELRRHKPLTVYLVRVWEPDPPPGVEAVDWVLLSSLPVVTLADAKARVEWYRCRWLCEDYHQCLKTGCHIERSQLDTAADICRLLGFAIPIAVRLLQLRQAARQPQPLPATLIVEPLLVQVLARRLNTAWQTMTAEQFWHGIARLGGHQGRRRDGPPGWRTVWRGWRYLADLTDGARLFVDNNPSRN